MSTILKEGRAEAKGYPLTGGGVQKNSKKLILQLTQDGLLSFLDSGKTEYSIQFNCYVEVNPDAKKKRLNITVDADTTIVVEPDDDVSGWLDAITKATPPRYFGAEMSAVTKDQHEIPQLIEHALQALEKHMDVDGLFRISGSKPDIETLRKLYDSNQKPNNLLHYDVHTVTGVFKLYLRQLPTPLVPFTHYNSVIGLSNHPDIPGSFASLLAEFPLQSQIVLKAICLFMQKVGLQSSVNQMTHSNLAIVVAPNLMRPAVESMETATHSQHIIPVFAAIFEHADKIFAGVVGPKPSPSNPRSRPVSMGFASPSSLPPVPSSMSNRGESGGAPPSLGSVPEGSTTSEPVQPPSRRPVSMAIPGGIGSVMAAGAKLPPVPAAGAKKGLRPTPPAGGPPVGGSSGANSNDIHPTDSASNNMLNGAPNSPAGSAGGAPQFQLPAVPGAGPPSTAPSAGGPKKMPFGQIPERSSNSGASSTGGSSDSLGVVPKSVSLSSLPKTPPAFGKRAVVVPLTVSEASDMPPPTLGTPQTPPSLPPVPLTPGTSAAHDKKDPTIVTPAPSEDEAAREAEAAQWKSYENDDGRTYYHNEVTNVTQWEKPDCLKKRVKKHRKGNSSSTSREELMGTLSPSTPAAAKSFSSSSDSLTASSSTASLSASQPTRATPSKRKTDRAQTTTSAPNMVAVNAIAATLPGAVNATSLPPPVTSLPPAMATPSLSPSSSTSNKPSLSDAERLAAVEAKLAILEKTVSDQARLIEQLLATQRS